MEDWSIVYEKENKEQLSVVKNKEQYSVAKNREVAPYTIIGLDDELHYHINNTEVTSWDEEIMMLSYKTISDCAAQAKPVYKTSETHDSLSLTAPKTPSEIVSSHPEDTNTKIPKSEIREEIYPRMRKYPESLRGLVCRTQGIEGKPVSLPDFLYHKDIISYGLPAPYEFTTKDNLEFLEKIYVENTRETMFEKDIVSFASYEGTLIRVFNVESTEKPLDASLLNLKGEFKAHKWYVATNRKLHAKDSSWCCNTNFGDLFQLYLIQNLKKHQSPILKESIYDEEAIDTYLNTLDREYEYVFLIKNNNQNRIVCRPSENQSISRDPSNLLFICRIRKNGDIHYDTTGLNIPFDTPERIPSCYKFEEILESVEDIDINKHQGIIMFVGSNIRCMTQYKIYNNTYKKLYDLRGNAVNVLWRFIEIIKKEYSINGPIYEATSGYDKPSRGLITNDGGVEYLDDLAMEDMDDVELFYRLYYDTHEIINSFVPKLRGIVGYIKSSYITRYIKKDYIMVPKPFFKVMELCHAWHLEDKDNHKINEDIITDKIFEMETVDIFQLFKLYPDKLKSE